MDRNPTSPLRERASSRSALSVAPAQPTARPLPSGLQWPFGSGGKGPALFVPADLPAGPLPLAVLLHGATSTPQRVLSRIQDEAERQKTLILAPKSHATTWDAIGGAFGPDVVALNRALAYLFDHFPIDPARIALAGFSDGATYALSLGLANGDFFRFILAFSPGFVIPGLRRGRPSIFISHGTQDAILPIRLCSREIAPALRREGYGVDYREFVGGHGVPPEMAAAALGLLA
ncbi:MULTISPECIES: phospholipase [Rhodomicrobium]|uniref:alpha/beta hydrolase n=1 Tax=Rhodomicrobium TaxID=1068 RepID=UPI000F739FEC|nr:MULTISPECIES: phospholipase [Rhodomicrobium]